MLLSKRKSSRKKAIIRNGPVKGNEKIPDIPFVQILLLDRFMIAFAVPIIANLLIPDHDADAFRPPPAPPGKGMRQGWLDETVDWVLSGYKRWDALHFMHIAEYGYSFENSLAFFPFYPILTRLITELWHPILPHLSFANALLFTGSIINGFAFLGAGYFLYILTRRALKNSTLAFLSVVIFAVNPASIFFSACYSESVFSLLTWGGLASLYRNPKRPYLGTVEASVFFGLALVTRSNGLLNIGFIGFILLSKAINQWRDGEYSGTITSILMGLLALFVIVTPFFYHQYHVWSSFCLKPRPTSRDMIIFAKENDYILPGDLPHLPWCNQSIPISYQSVQNRYWNVGFLGYYRIRKIPCFFLAAPAFIIAFTGIFQSLIALKPSTSGVMEVFGNPESMLPFALHSLALAVVGLFFMNVEVFTRFLFSATPFPYWFLAKSIRNSWKVQEHEEVQLNIKDSDLFSSIQFLWKSSTFYGKLIIVYLLSYAIIGAILHSNFYPWT